MAVQQEKFYAFCGFQSPKLFGPLFTWWAEPLDANGEAGSVEKTLVREN